MKRICIAPVLAVCIAAPLLTNTSPAHAATQEPANVTRISTNDKGSLVTLWGETNDINHVSVEKTKQGLRAHVYLDQLSPHTNGDKLYEEYERKSPSSVHGRKFRDQLVCHMSNVALWKNPWNLESWRPDVGYTKTVLAMCNPGGGSKD